MPSRVINQYVKNDMKLIVRKEHTDILTAELRKVYKGGEEQLLLYGTLREVRDLFAYFLDETSNYNC